MTRSYTTNSGQLHCRICLHKRHKRAACPARHVTQLAGSPRLQQQKRAASSRVAKRQLQAYSEAQESGATRQDKGGNTSRFLSFLSAWDALAARLPRTLSGSAVDSRSSSDRLGSSYNAQQARHHASQELTSAIQQQTVQEAGMVNPPELILQALKLSVAWMARLDCNGTVGTQAGRAQGVNAFQQRATTGPVHRQHKASEHASVPSQDHAAVRPPQHASVPPSAIMVASRLADLAACGFPIDNEVIAAAILAESTDLNALDAATVEQKLGSSVLALLRDIARVRCLPHRVEVLDDEAASGLRELCLSFYDVRAVVVEVVSRVVSMTGPQASLQPLWARQVAALEALQLYAPLGHALGLGAFSSELEDRCFQDLFPQSYQETATWLRQECLAHTDVLQRCSKRLQAALAADEGMQQLAQSADVYWRTKSLYSTMRKLLALNDFKRGGRSREQVYDLLGLRVIVHARTDKPPVEAEQLAIQACYRAAEVAHSLWQPVLSRQKDYIAHPKPNGYGSLHSAVLVPSLTVDVSNTASTAQGDVSPLSQDACIPACNSPCQLANTMDSADHILRSVHPAVATSDASQANAAGAPTTFDVSLDAQPAVTMAAVASGIDETDGHVLQVEVQQTEAAALHFAAHTAASVNGWNAAADSGDESVLGTVGASSAVRAGPSQMGGQVGSVTPGGCIAVELQIRTEAMHLAAETGEAAHTAYKAGLAGRQARQLRAWTDALQHTTVLLCAPGQLDNESRAGNWHQAVTQLFQHLDKDSDGRLSHAELQELVMELGFDVASGVAAEEAAAAMQALAQADASGAGITLEQFVDFQKKMSMVHVLPHVDRETAELLRGARLPAAHRQTSEGLVPGQGTVLTTPAASPGAAVHATAAPSPAERQSSMQTVGPEPLAAVQGMQLDVVPQLFVDGQTDAALLQQRQWSGCQAGSSGSAAAWVQMHAGAGGLAGRRVSMVGMQRRCFTAACAQARRQCLRVLGARHVVCAEPVQVQPMSEATTSSWTESHAAVAVAVQADVKAQQQQPAATAVAAGSRGRVRDPRLRRIAKARPTAHPKHAAPQGLPGTQGPVNHAASEHHTDTAKLHTPSSSAAEHHATADTVECATKSSLSSSHVSAAGHAAPQQAVHDGAVQASDDGGLNGKARLQASAGGRDSTAMALDRDNKELQALDRRQDSMTGAWSSDEEEQLELVAVMAPRQPVSTASEASSSKKPSSTMPAPVLVYSGAAAAAAVRPQPPRPQPEPLQAEREAKAARLRVHNIRRNSKLRLRLVALASAPFELVDPDTGKAAAGGCLLPPIGPFVLGAVPDRDNDVMVDMSTVSGRHVRFEIIVNNQQGRKCILTDLGSTNGTWVNSARILPFQDVEVFAGDIISIGEVGVSFQLLQETGPNMMNAIIAQNLKDKVSVTLASTSNCADRAREMWSSGLQCAPLQEVQDAVRQLSRQKELRTAAHLLCLAVQVHPDSASLTGQLANLYRRLAHRGLCGHGATRAAYRAAISLLSQAESSATSRLRNAVRQAAMLREAGKRLSLQEHRFDQRQGDVDVNADAALHMSVGAAEKSRGANSSRMQEWASEAAAMAEQVAACREDKGQLQEQLIRMYTSWASVEYDLGHLSSARRLFQRAITIAKYHVLGFANGGGVRVLLVFAQHEWAGGNVTSANDLLRRALIVEPNNTECLSLLGSIAVERGDVVMARTCYQRALQTEPSHVRTLTLLAGMEASEGNVAEARNLYREGVQQNPDNVILLKAWAVAEASVGNMDIARRLFERAATVSNRRSVQVLQAWGAMELEDGNVDTALQILREAHALHEGNGMVMTSLGAAELAAGNRSEAQQLLQRAAAVMPTSLKPLWVLRDLAESSKSPTLLNSVEREIGVRMTRLKRARNARSI